MHYTRESHLPELSKPMLSQISETGFRIQDRLTGLAAFVAPAFQQTGIMTMSTYAPDTPAAPSRTMHGLVCIEIGMLFFVVQDAMMKSLLMTYPVWLLICIRSLVAIIVLTPLIIMLGAPHRLLTPLWPLHFLRAGLFALGFSLFYAAFPFMGLAEVTTIFFSAPLITALLASLLLKETIGPHRIGALVIGFIGVIIAMNPTGDAFSWIAILPLACALTYALGQILARYIGDRDSTLTMGLYTLAPAAPLIMIMGWSLNQIVDIGPEFQHLRWAFPAEAMTDIPRLALLGSVGMAGYLFLSRAYQVANASFIAPFDYSYLPMAVVLAYVLWNEVPPTATVIGMGLIIASGLYLGYRELRATRHSDDQPVVAETVFAPGSPLSPQNTEEDSPL
ncbi:EamA-like transporter family protein [Roseovarius aestuarii]|uniref:EamA-like transporter family protein n=2 Tax=Roseovarius aestuarii TaxID=475083 RepID=A0A1X7BVY4_9RHOB|nr:EamA-like transporter family protein [Roseovarius aestuarii]